MPHWRGVKVAAVTIAPIIRRAMKPSPSVPSPGYAASPELVAESIVRAALLEDVGHGGDITTEAIVPPQRRATARIVARHPGVVAGLPLAMLAFRMLDDRVTGDVRIGEGERVE